MFLNESRFASEGITMIYLFLTHPNPSSSENLPLAISDLTRLEMRLGESSINYMLRVRGISQRMQGITMERIIPLFATKSLDHDRYPGVNSCYLTGDTALVNCDLLELSGLLPSEETQQRASGIPSAHPSTTVANRVSNTSTQLPPEGCPAPHPPQPPAQSSTVAYPPLGGVPWKCIDAMMQEDKSCPGCHYNHPEYTPQLKFHQEVVCPALSKHGYLFRKYVKASAKVVDKFDTNFPKIPD